MNSIENMFYLTSNGNEKQGTMGKLYCEMISFILLCMFVIMWKTYSTKTHLWWFDSKDYNKEKMERYRRMQMAIQSDSMIDDEDLLYAIQNIKHLLEKNIVSLMKKWYSIPA